jgi:hypothetical protein
MLKVDVGGDDAVTVIHVNNVEVAMVLAKASLLKSDVSFNFLLAVLLAECVSQVRPLSSHLIHPSKASHYVERQVRD